METTYPRFVFQTATTSTLDAPPGTIVGEIYGPTGSSNCPRCLSIYENNWCPRCRTEQSGHVRILLVTGRHSQPSQETTSLPQEGAFGRKGNKHWVKRKQMPPWAKQMRK